MMSPVMRPNEQTLLSDIGRRLIERFPDVARHVVDTVVREEHARFGTSPIRDFIPLLVEKSARRQLASTR
jgi:hypothetical protein